MDMKLLTVLCTLIVMNTGFARDYTPDEQYVIQHKPEMKIEIDKGIALEESLSGIKRVKLEKIYRRSYQVLRSQLEGNKRS